MFSYFISTSCLHDKDPIKVYEHPSSDSLPWLATLCVCGTSMGHRVTALTAWEEETQAV